MHGPGAIGTNPFIPAFYNETPDAPQAPAPIASTAEERLGPQLLHSGEGSPWIPQGQGYDADRKEILTSYYGGRSDGVLLSIQTDSQDPGSTAEVRSVILGGARADSVLEEISPAPNKGGGVATNGEYVYLADTEAVYVYRRADIDATDNTCSVPVAPVHVIAMPKGFSASYLTVQGDQLYVGSFVQNLRDPFGLTPSQTPELYRIDINGADGSFDPAKPSGRIETPYNVQGAAVTDQGILFTTSYSNDRIASPHHLIFQSFDGPAHAFNAEPASEARSVYDLDYYAEGVNIINGEVWVTYESGADKYLGKAEEDRDHIHRIPLGQLDDH